MTSKTSTGWDESLRAAYWYHCQHNGEVPAQVSKARTGLSALVKKLAGDEYRKPTRDERRLLAHYERVKADHNAQVLEAYRSATAPSEKE